MISSRDGRQFPLNQDVLDVIEAYAGDDLSTNLSSEVITKVLDFCGHLKAEPIGEIAKPLKKASLAGVVPKFYVDFLAANDALLPELLKAADELDIKPLLDLLCAHIAAMLKGESAVEQLKQVTYSNDFTDEELASFRAENKWLEAV
jgi:S-phase kinase-associated protein 1